MLKNKKMKQMNSNHLKLIAIAAMTLDHIADLMFPAFTNNIISVIMHIIGRLTAPIMFFFICEGFYYTKNLRKYIMRMFVFAVISHFAYCFAFGINFVPFAGGEIFNQTSIIWTLAWAIVALYVHSKENLNHWQKTIIILLICVITFSADWSCIAVMAILSMYSNRGNIKKQILGMFFWVLIYAVVSYFFVNKIYGFVSLAAIIVYPFLKCYNGERGKIKGLKWFFYVYYPMHLTVIGVLRLTIYGDVPLLF